MFQNSALVDCLATFDERNAISLDEAIVDDASNEIGTNIKENATYGNKEGKDDEKHITNIHQLE